MYGGNVRNVDIHGKLLYIVEQLEVVVQDVQED